MPRQAIVSKDAPAPQGAYSPVIRAGQFLFVSGQAAIDPATGKVQGTTIGEQVEVTMRNIEAQLAGAGASLDDVVKTNAYLADFSDFDAFNRAYATFFKNDPPARTTVGAQLIGILVEIDVIAYTG